ncbi:DDE-type integrase/transposase/recombinase [Acinetobacter shaoyimingii]|uniref:DDE-type integrase/transposase/recombinase n=1 Tax=Acinetobacter shaoyimingii TaxID=2715164 RepID=A0A6G8RZJ5_9GAMM|nr:DDE-type integrase/transposase/recombinase [Acinetobacter shaoyimingii]QIO07285.1 DDE-type integrase/transposase/recombinase [Acinetobacter shaoyimingii]
MNLFYLLACMLSHEIKGLKVIQYDSFLLLYKNAFPIEVSRTEILKGLEDGNIERAIDPHESLAFIQPEKESVQEIKRDQNYALIYPLISHELFYIPVQRGKIISEIMNQHEVTKQTIYRLARRYWQRGQTPNALLPDYRNSGAKGQKRIAKDKKLGRPRIHNSEQGINVNENIEKLFYRTIKLFFLKDNKHSLPFVYRKFQTTYKNLYPDIAESDIPTIWQFKYYYEKEFKKIESIKSRIGTSSYRKDYRPLQSTSNAQVTGPGARYEIDATIADIYLVSNSNPESIVGRPTIYFVIDVFSRLVAGFYIGFEPPSYLAAIQALNIAMTDKVQYCAEYGISIQPEDWPAVGLPDALLADRGELLGYQIEVLEKTFAVRLENAPARRGDAKGIVEQAFNTYQAYFKKEGKGNGVVEGTTVKKTGGNDYRRDATLNIHQFTEIILACIISHNQFHVLKTYDRESDMPNDLPTIPLHLWNWGIQNRTGKLRSVPEEALRIALLPRTKITISDLGIKAFGLYYLAKEVLDLGWLHRKTGSSRPQNLEAAYDPYSVNKIYIFPKDNSLEYWIGSLSDRSREFIDCTLWEVKERQKAQKEHLVQHELEASKKRRELEAFISEKLKTKLLKSPIKPSQRIAEITENKAKEKNIERKAKVKQQEIVDTNIIPMSKLKTSIKPQAAETVHYPDLTDELFGEDE